jgi:uncharacterized membrane protein YhaH (DUF805 family)
MLMEWMLMPLKRYAEFSGRSRRKEYWLYTLFVIILSIICMLLDRALGLNGILGTASAAAGEDMGALQLLLLVATFVPSLAVSVRRLHDGNRPGWWLLLMLIPYGLGLGLMGAGAAGGQFGLLAVAGIFMLIGLIAAIVLLVFMCLPGTSGPNKYGPDPLDPSGAELGEVFS